MVSETLVPFATDLTGTARLNAGVLTVTGIFDPSPNPLSDFWELTFSPTNPSFIMKAVLKSSVIDLTTTEIFPQFSNPETSDMDPLEIGVSDGLEAGLARWPDEFPPRCDLTNEGINKDGKKFIQITLQDTGSGLAAIDILEDTNAEVNIPFFNEGTNFDVIVTATKKVQTESAIVRLKGTDYDGNVVGDPNDPEHPCDPVLTRAEIPEGRRRVSETFSGIPQAERYITVQNGDPGLSGLLVTVNGAIFPVTHLGDTEERTTDVASAMAEGDTNTIMLTAYGQPGASADITIHDGTLAPTAAGMDRQPYVRWRVGRQLQGRAIEW
jgi:hypothetical protein